MRHFTLCILVMAVLPLLAAGGDEMEASAAGVTAYGQEDTIPVYTVLEKIPTFVHMYLQQNVLGFATGSIIYVYDLDTGQRRWMKSCKYKGKHYDVTFGKNYVVMFREDRFIALDKATGAELWQKEMGRGQYIEYAYFCLYADWLWLRCEDGQVLYVMDAQKGYRIPFEEYSRWGTMPDGERLYEFRANKDTSSRTHLDVMFWKPGDLQATKQFSLESPGELIRWGETGNMFLVSDILYKRSPEHILRAHDAMTGEVIREFDPAIAATISLHGRRFLSRDTGRFIWMDEEEQHHLHTLNIATGNASTIAVPEGFNVTYNDFTTDAEGKVWFLAWYKDYSLFLLPFNHDAAPRKLLDGSRFLPSRISILRPPYLLAYHYAKSLHTSVFRLDNMQLLAEWPGDAQYLRISKDAQYGALIKRDEEGPASIASTYMYSREKEEPLFKVKGSPVTVSPDGRYLVLYESKDSHNYPRIGATREDYEAYKQELFSKNAVHVIDVTTKESVLRFDLTDLREDAIAVFSENSRYLALCHSDILRLLDIDTGFAETILSVPDNRTLRIYPVCFSPGNTQLLTSASGRADVFDVFTGRHIQSFKETAKLVPDSEWQPRDPDFLKIVENRLRSFAGRFTDRFTNKKTPSIYAAFAKNGEQVVTVAESRLIRIWETETGRLIRTIDPELPETRHYRGSIGNAITLSGNGAYALTYNRNGFDDGTLWDLEKGVKIRRYTFEGDNVQAALSENGDRVYALINEDLHFLAGARSKN